MNTLHVPKLERTAEADAVLAASPVVDSGVELVDPLIKLDRTLALVGVSRTTWLDAVRAGEAPSPYRVYGRVVAWKLSEVRAFIESRPRVTRAGAASC